MSASSQLNSWVGSSFRRLAPTTANLFRAFTPNVPMGVPGTSREKRMIVMDVPPKLQQQLNKGLPLIGDDCLKENAEYVLDVFETICIEHVISTQVADRTLRKVLAHNPVLECQDPETVGKLTADSRIARSSYLGQDPCGDKPVIPEKKGNTGTDEDAAEGSVPDETGKAVYSEVQLLMINIQDKNYHYLTAHLPKLLHPSILSRVWEAERRYEGNVEALAKTARNRMPWAEYRSAVLALLPESSGLFELLLMLALFRENGETATLWAQRIAKGKEWLKIKHGFVLTDKLCWDLLGRYLTREELLNMVEALKNKTHSASGTGSAVTAGSSHKKISAAEAKKHLATLEWTEILDLVKLHAGEKKRYREREHRSLVSTRLFTLEQALAYMRAHDHDLINKLLKAKTVKGSNQFVYRCQKCWDAGLRGKLINHFTKDCNARLREHNVKMKRRNTGRQESEPANKRRTLSAFKKVRKERGQLNKIKECGMCKKAGRSFRHPEKECKYAPGGDWHGKTKEQVHALQIEFYRNKNKSRGTQKALTNATKAVFSGRKRRRNELKDLEPEKLNDVISWQHSCNLANIVL